MNVELINGSPDPSPSAGATFGEASRPRPQSDLDCEFPIHIAIRQQATRTFLNVNGFRVARIEVTAVTWRAN